MTKHAQFSTQGSKRACLVALAMLLLAELCLGGTAITPASAALTTTADFYVATNGDDSWPGTLSQPFRTVDRARLAVEALKLQVSGRTITVFIRYGTYFLPSTWTFTSL